MSGPGVTMTPASPLSTAELSTRLIRAAKSSLVNAAGTEGPSLSSLPLSLLTHLWA
jgi:hypothetical protein